MSTITTKHGAEVSDDDFGQGISELSSRSANGLDVALLWQQCDGTAFVVAYRLDLVSSTASSNGIVELRYRRHR